MADPISGNLDIQTSASRTTIRLNPALADIVAGGNQAEGTFIVKDKSGNDVMRLGFAPSHPDFSGLQFGPAVILNNQSGPTIRLTSGGDVSLGGHGVDGDLRLKNRNGETTLHLDGQTGEIKIKDWSMSVPDYVFANDYNLPRLDELESYIRANRHLPDIPSGEEIVKEGIHIGQFCLLLLKKIEEMSLYTIQQARLMGEQSTRLSELEQRLSEIQA